MSLKNKPLGGVWSATPTPFDENLNLDRASIPRLVEHHLRLGVGGLFLCGTAGEGMVMPDAQRRQFVRDVVKHNRGRMTLAMQVSDNSVARVLDNIRNAKEDGVDIAIVAPPPFMMNATPRRISDFFLGIFDRAPLPVGLYERGKHAAIGIPEKVLARLLQHPGVILMKDSSSDRERMNIALAARRKRKGLVLLSGDEFHTASYMIAGYDGLMLGGAIFNGYLAGQVIEAVAAGNHNEARRIDARIVRMNRTVFGGPSIKCWLSGQKRLCVELGIFRTWSNYYDYPLTPGCERAIVRLAQREAEVLKPSLRKP